MSDHILVTGQSELAQRIANALGFEEFAVKSLELTVDADKPISVKAIVYPTKEQLEALEGEIEKFRQFGIVKASVEFNYEQERP